MRSCRVAKVASCKPSSHLDHGTLCAAPKSVTATISPGVPRAVFGGGILAEDSRRVSNDDQVTRLRSLAMKKGRLWISLVTGNAILQSEQDENLQNHHSAL